MLTDAKTTASHTLVMLTENSVQGRVRYTESNDREPFESPPFL